MAINSESAIPDRDALIETMETELTDRDQRLHNDDLAPVPANERKWGAFAIFNVWTNDVQSLAGYTLAASLFVGAGISGWWVFAAIILAGFVVMILVNLSGRPSVRYGIPYAVMARTQVGVLGARVPALIRGIVGMFWFGAQTYFAATAVSLAINAVVTTAPKGEFLGMNMIDWISLILVMVFQVILFGRGLQAISKFLNFAGPAVYIVMILMLIGIWVQAGSDLLVGVGNLFKGDKTGFAAIVAFFSVMGTMIAYFAAVVVNFGDFSRQTTSVKAMRRGNFWGLPVSLTFFTFLALFITAGTYMVYLDGQGEPATNPADMVGLAGNPALTIVAAITFFLATVGINLVANFIPPAYDLANLLPAKISFRVGGWITAIFGFIVGALWVVAIGSMGLPKFVDTLGAVLAPLYGVLVVDYYVLRKQRLHVRDAFTMRPEGIYHFRGGWNVRALGAAGLAAVFSMLTVWLPALSALGGFAWLLGAVLGGLFHFIAMRGRVIVDPPTSPEANEEAQFQVAVDEHREV